jgi:FtsH-binding integral membrane protein
MNHTVSDRQSRVAGFVSLAPIVFGLGFAVYAFTLGTVDTTTYDGYNTVVSKETIVESGGAAGVVLALAPLILAVFLAVLLRFARDESDTTALTMAWVFSGFVAIVSLLGVLTLGPFLIVPAVLMLAATGFTRRACRGLHTGGRQPS